MTIVLYHPARILLLILLHLIEAHFKSHARSLSLSFLYFLFSLWLGSICFLRCARGCPGSVTARYTLKWICIKHKHIFLSFLMCAHLQPETINQSRISRSQNLLDAPPTDRSDRPASQPAIIIIEQRILYRDAHAEKRLFPICFFLRLRRVFIFSRPHAKDTTVIN